ncbi:S26 family signal peptidase [Cryobacterium melibiosiphilum]|uniref:S26 family signal peptidase n=2 Tax=Cryobacterium melibiosiphilum TaxID=995039 RepID=A0A3A5MEC3_9MICO|nr:S26 family signal peptidase [Cryobacterium melibiosiphilum]
MALIERADAAARPRRIRRPDRAARTRRGAGPWIKELLLTLAGLAGVISMGWFAASSIFGLTVVIFMTGSMAPGLPTGSAGIAVNDVPAASLSVGDIVTVPREGRDLPVTHRIIAIDPVPGAPATRSLTLQGDANATPDREAYMVETVQRTVFGVAGAGFALRALQTPLLLGAVTLLVALLVVWAFWPAPPVAGRPNRRRHSPRYPASEEFP